MEWDSKELTMCTVIVFINEKNPVEIRTAKDETTTFVGYFVCVCVGFQFYLFFFYKSSSSSGKAVS